MFVEDAGLDSGVRISTRLAAATKKERASTTRAIPHALLCLFMRESPAEV